MNFLSGVTLKQHQLFSVRIKTSIDQAAVPLIITLSITHVGYYFSFVLGFF